jgi:hypothetical protein
VSAASIKLEGMDLGVGDTRRVTCPFCGERTCNITRQTAGLVYHCHRASCDASGFVPTAGQLLTPEKDRGQELNPWTGARYRPVIADYQFFEDVYELPEETVTRHIALAGDGRYVLPIEDTRGYERGVVLRQPWPGAPRDSTGGAKAVAYWHAVGPRQAFYRAPQAYMGGGRLVLVEDQLSAIKAAASNAVGWAVSMLGTGGSLMTSSMGGTDAIQEIASLRPSEVIIAYDADAAERGFRWARKWGLAFPRVRVAVLERDIKDTRMADIADALGIEE